MCKVHAHVPEPADLQVSRASRNRNQAAELHAQQKNENGHATQLKGNGVTIEGRWRVDGAGDDVDVGLGFEWQKVTFDPQLRRERDILPIITLLA